VDCAALASYDAGRGLKPQPIGADSLLLIFLSNPLPLAGLLLFRNVSSDFSFF
jgi:hypothetical protein